MSSDTFSFDQAAPAEAMDSSNIGSNESCVVQSSPDGSYSNVTSAQRSDSTKRSRPQIEDADRESRAVGRVRASPTRATKFTSSQRSDKKGSVRKTHEDLDRMISSMKSQGDQLKAQVLRLEDERSAELSMFGNKMQSIKGECTDFDQQYNHVLSCWRLAEERSTVYEMELRSEIGLFQEVREYLGEMQQHFGNVAQEDY